MDTGDATFSYRNFETDDAATMVLTGVDFTFKWSPVDAMLEEWARKSRKAIDDLNCAPTDQDYLGVIGMVGQQTAGFTKHANCVVAAAYSFVPFAPDIHTLLPQAHGFTHGAEMTAERQSETAGIGQIERRTAVIVKQGGKVSSETKGQVIPLASCGHLARDRAVYHLENPIIRNMA